MDQQITRVNSGTIINRFPQALLEELINIGETINQSYWRIGDITNELTLLALANHETFGKMEICAAIAEIIGKSARSVRYYASVSSFYQPTVREFYDTLPFSHFAFAMQYSGQTEGVPIWQSILDKGMGSMEKYGVPISTDKLSAIFHKEQEQYQEDYANDTLPPSLLHSGEGNCTPVSFDNSDRRTQVIREIENLLSPLPDLLTELVRVEGRSDLATEIAKAIATVRSVEELITRSGAGVYHARDVLVLSA